MRQIADMNVVSSILLVLLAITVLAAGGVVTTHGADHVTKVFTLDPSTHPTPRGSPSTRAVGHSSSAPPATAQSIGVLWTIRCH